MGDFKMLTVLIVHLHTVHQIVIVFKGGLHLRFAFILFDRIRVFEIENRPALNHDIVQELLYIDCTSVICIKN